MNWIEILNIVSTISTTIIALGIVLGLFSGVGKKIKKLLDTPKDLQSLGENLSSPLKLICKALTNKNVGILPEDSRCSIIKAQGVLEDKFPINVKSQSPSALTELGLTKLENSGLKKMILKEKDFLFKQFEGQHFDSKYDIQECSFKTMKEFIQSNSEVIVLLKNYAYENGMYDFANEFVEIGGIYLRDLYLNKK